MGRARRDVRPPTGAGLTVPAHRSRSPGTLELTPAVSADSAEGEVSGVRRASARPDVRRVPFWFRVTRPALAAASSVDSARAGGSTPATPEAGAARVSGYRYPEVPAGGSVTSVLTGPEQVYRVELASPSRTSGSRSRSAARACASSRGSSRPATRTASPATRRCPSNLNPYLSQFGERVLAAGAVRPLAGAYDVVFDSASAAGAGRFSFRFWIDDTTPADGPARACAGCSADSAFVVRVADAGSGVDAATLDVKVDGKTRARASRGGSRADRDRRPAAGPHGLRLQVSDYQESRNMESVPPILPNTRVLATTVGRSLAPGPSSDDAARAVSRSSIVGNASRSCLDAADEVVVVGADRRGASPCASRAHGGAGRPRLPRRSNLGHSAATSTPTPIASSTIHGQLTITVYPPRRVASGRSS